MGKICSLKVCDAITFSMEKLRIFSGSTAVGSETFTLITFSNVSVKGGARAIFASISNLFINKRILDSTNPDQTRWSSGDSVIARIWKKWRYRQKKSDLANKSVQLAWPCSIFIIKSLPRANSVVITARVDFDTLWVEHMEGYAGVITGIRWFRSDG